MSIEEKDAVAEPEAVQAVTAEAEESAATADTQQSPDNDNPVAGEQGVADAQALAEIEPETGTEPDGEPADSDTETPEDRATRKSRTRKRIEKFREENAALKDQLRAALSAPSAPPAVTASNTVKPEDSPDYWLSRWQNATDDADKAQAATRYNALYQQKLENDLLAKLEARQQQQRQAHVLAEELYELHEFSPLLKQENGQLSFDQSSELFRAAAAQAAKAGDRLDHPAKVVLYGNKAARLLSQLGNGAEQARARQTQTKLKEVVAKTGMQPPRSGGAGTAKLGKSPEAELKKLRALRDAGDPVAAEKLARLAVTALYSQG